MVSLGYALKSFACYHLLSFVSCFVFVVSVCYQFVFKGFLYS